MKRFEKTTFVIYEFMTELLGLSGCELLVFALLYSFCRGAGGAFWGSRQYLSERLGISVSSVDRAVKCLKLKGLIYTPADEYRIDMEALAERCEKAEKEKNRKKAVEKSLNRNLKTEKTQFEESSPSEKREEFVNLTANNKEYIKGDTKENIPSIHLSGAREEENFLVDKYVSGYASANEEKEMSAYEPPEKITERINIIFLGRFGAVKMSREQYSHLCSIVDAEVVDEYIYKLEEYVIANKKTFNHYDILIGWIKRDFVAKR